MASKFPIQVVTAWLGNSPIVALQHTVSRSPSCKSDWRCTGPSSATDHDLQRAIEQPEAGLHASNAPRMQVLQAAAAID